MGVTDGKMYGKAEVSGVFWLLVPCAVHFVHRV